MAVGVSVGSAMGVQGLLSGSWRQIDNTILRSYHTLSLNRSDRHAMCTSDGNLRALLVTQDRASGRIKKPADLSTRVGSTPVPERVCVLLVRSWGASFPPPPWCGRQTAPLAGRTVHVDGIRSATGPPRRTCSCICFGSRLRLPWARIVPHGEVRTAEGHDDMKRRRTSASAVRRPGTRRTPRS